MAKKEKFRNRDYNDLNGTSDPDFDLDEYIRQQSMGGSQLIADDPALNPDDSYQFKNAVLIFFVCAAAFLWLNEWSPRQAISNLFGSESAGQTTVTAPEINIDLPAFPEITIPLPPGVSDNAGYADYLASIRDAGLSDLYSNSGYQALYQTGVPVEYLSQLTEAGYEDFSYSAVIGLYSSGVTIDYLNALSEYGYLEQFSYSAIIGLYSSGVTVEYLNALNNNDHLDQFSYSGIIGLYNGDVPSSYLDQLAAGEYLDRFSYSAIIGMYNSGVTVEYIDQLKNRNLLNDMSYSDIIVAYNTDN